MLSTWTASSASKDCCQWHGVECSSSNDHVTGLILNNCDGQDPSDQAVLLRLHQQSLIAHLTSSAISALAQGLPRLSRFDFGCQNLHGSIPPEIGNLTSLTYLDLSFQSTDTKDGIVLTGPIPDTLWSLPELSYVDLRYNYLTGSISDLVGNCSTLTALRLTTNNLTGSIPESIANLSSLLYLEFASNAKIDTLPPQTWIPLFQLQSLDISWCDFSGSFPAWLSTQRNLSEFTLTSNHFTGEIPPWAWRLATQYLDFSGNAFNNTLTCGTASAQSEQPYPSLISLDISENQLAGEIPCFIANLTSLTTLSFAGNYFTGAIPDVQFANLTSLQFLDLSGNRFRGNIPASFSNLRWLQILGLSSNMLSQEIPSFLFTIETLEMIDLSDNQFTGAIPSVSPSAVTLNSSLQYLKLSYNNLSGEIPSSLAALHSNLIFLMLDHNNLEGPVPTRLSQLSNLETLVLSSNNLQGPLPFSLLKLSKLVTLNAANNPIGGPIPPFIKHLEQLLLLDLRSCKLNGSIPAWIGSKLQQLQILDLSRNLLTGSLPSSLGELNGIISPNEGTSASVVASHGDNYIKDDLNIDFKGEPSEYVMNLQFYTFIDLSYNRLSGQIPAALGDLEALLALDLSSNLLSGAIPASLGNLRKLESLDLSRNALGGSIPESFNNLSALGYVNLSSNHLQGSIPSAGQWGTFNISSFLDNDGLCRTRYSSVAVQLPICSDNSTSSAEPPPAWINGEKFEIEDYILWPAFAVGYPFGVTIGFILVLLHPLITQQHRKKRDEIRKPQRSASNDDYGYAQYNINGHDEIPPNRDWQAIIAGIRREFRSTSLDSRSLRPSSTLTAYSDEISLKQSGSDPRGSNS